MWFGCHECINDQPPLFGGPHSVLDHVRIQDIPQMFGIRALG
jgi:hypothetical protein